MGEQTNPTLYIIGGVPRTGKTTLAERLQHELHVTGTELDHLRALFNADAASTISYNSRANIHLVTKQLSPYLEHLYAHLVGSSTSHVINGEVISPFSLEKSAYFEYMRPCFMGISDTETTLENVRLHQSSVDWTTSLPDNRLRGIFDTYVRRSEKISRQCAEIGIRYFDVTADFLTAHGRAFEYLMNCSAEPSLEAASNWDN
jgi:hypothetical protein